MLSFYSLDLFLSSHKQKALFTDFLAEMATLKKEPHWYNGQGKHFFCALFKVLIIKDLDKYLELYRM